MASRSDAVPPVSGSSSGGFQQVVAAFRGQPGLPFASVLSAGRVARIFARHRNLFGQLDARAGAGQANVQRF